MPSKPPDSAYDGRVKKEEQVQLNVRVPSSVRKALRALAALKGKSQAEVLEEVIAEALQKELAEAAEEIKRRGRRVIP